MRVSLLFAFLCLSACIPVKAQQPLWEEKDVYVNGFSRVFQQGRFTFIDGHQKLISPFVFEDARNFHHQLAAVKRSGKWGFINQQGITVLPFDYDIVFDFNDNVTVVSKTNKWWLADTTGRIIKQLDISVCYGFNNGLAIVYNNGTRGKLFKNGSIIYENPVPVIKKEKIPYAPSNVNSVCPANLDFEFGNFTNWQCYIGQVDSVGTTNVITVNPSPPTPGRHTIYTRALPSAVDPFGLFPTNPPDGSLYAVKLGNTNVGAQAERIRYVIHVPLNDSNFSFRYHYAVVLQDPGHTPWTQPRFTAKLFDSAANAYVNCASFEYISTSNLPGFNHSTVDPTVIYKPWSAVFISLRGNAGKTFYLDFTTADCVRRAHWGYAYVDVENTCDQTIQAQYNCDTPHITTLTGPPGFQFYNWWNQNFTTILGTGQTVTLNPGPPPNSLIWLEMIPFANFGCTDTIPVRVTGTVIAHFDATDTFGICAPHSFTFYNRNIPSISATWDFGDGTTGVGDTVTHIYNLPGTYIVTLNVTEQAGCSGIATDTVRIVQPTGSYSYTGGNFCNNHQVLFTAVASFIDSLFWDFGDGTFLNTTLLTVTHTYTQAGIYIPRLVMHSNFGCQLLLPGPDTIRIEKLVPGYTSNIQHFCTYTTVTFTDTSYSFFGIVSKLWDFGDGTFGAGGTVSHTYTATGTYAVKLVITGLTGCRDSVVKNISIQVYNNPVSSITGPTQACMNSTLTFNGTVVSTDAVATMNWSCSNGASGTGNSFAVPFNSSGTFIVKLISGTIHGCYDTVTHIVNINPLPTATINGPATVCLNAPSPLVTFTGAGGTAPYTFTYSINGGSNQTVTTTSGNSVTVSAPTNIAGIFNYTLIGVQEGSSNACNQLQSGSVIITVKPLPTAVISGPAIVCLNTASPLVTFTGAGGTAPYTFTYSINGGFNQTVTTTSGNSVTVPAPTNIAGIFNYTLIGVQEGSSTTCSQLQSGSVIITVKPLPTAAISGPANACLNGAPPIVTFTGAGGTAPFTFTYSINGGPGQTVTTTSGNSASVTAPTNISGIFTYTIINILEASSTTCSQVQAVSTMVTIHPLPPVNAGIDKNLCLGSSVQLNATGAAQYSWSPPTGLSCINCANPIASPGNTIQYMVQGTSSFGCIANDTMNIKVIKPFPMQASPDDTVCAGHFVMLAASGANSYLWSPANGLDRTDIATPTATPQATTTYRVIGYDGYNCFSDTAYIKITVGPNPVVDAGPDITQATGNVVTLNPVIQNGPIIKWLWEPATDLSCSDCATPVLTIHNNITYWVTVTNQYNCIAKDAINIFTFCKTAQVFIPDAFTPDGDGLNDVLMVRGKGISVHYFRVFNRWGEMVFEKKDFAPNDPRYGWDGKIRGVPASPDVFVYMAEVICDNNVLYTLKGNVSLLK